MDSEFYKTAKKIVVWLWLIVLFVVAMGVTFLANVWFIQWAAKL